jgi:hypothetical protein
MDKRQANIDALAPLNNTDANGKFIQKQNGLRFEIGRLWGIFRKRKRQEIAKAQSNVELFMDDWLFHHGKKASELTDAERRNLLSDTVARVTAQHNARNQRKEDAEWREMQGALVDCEDDSAVMGDLPGDGDFAKAILKHERSKK